MVAVTLAICSTACRGEFPKYESSMYGEIAILGRIEVSQRERFDLTVGIDQLGHACADAVDHVSDRGGVTNEIGG